MQTQETQIDTPQESYASFQSILSDAELSTLFEKYGVKDIRDRKFSVYHFFGLCSSLRLSQVPEGAFYS